MRNWRFQWPFRWPITWDKPPLPHPETWEYKYVCNRLGCNKDPWRHQPSGKKMGYCYEHLRKFNWLSYVYPEDSQQQYEVGGWRDK